MIHIDESLTKSIVRDSSYTESTRFITGEVSVRVSGNELTMLADDLLGAKGIKCGGT